MTRKILLPYYVLCQLSEFSSNLTIYSEWHSIWWKLCNFLPNMRGGFPTLIWSIGTILNFFSGFNSENLNIFESFSEHDTEFWTYFRNKCRNSKLYAKKTWKFIKILWFFINFFFSNSEKSQYSEIYFPS
jgi:hypothetical protein